MTTATFDYTILTEALERKVKLFAKKTANIQEEISNYDAVKNAYELRMKAEFLSNSTSKQVSFARILSVVEAQEGDVVRTIGSLEQVRSNSYVNSEHVSDAISEVIAIHNDG